MNFNPLILDNECLGYFAENHSDFFFFGTRLGTIEKVARCFPEWRYRSLHQVHGNKLVLSTSHQVEADGHWTSEVKTALCIKTADCMPLLISHPEGIFAIHAGWRGIANGIILRALTSCQKNWGSTKDCQVTIGPHITQESFEVGQDVAQVLGRVYLELGPLLDRSPEIIRPHSDSSKRYVDLMTIAREQLRSGGVAEDQIFSFAKNTLTSDQFFSFRRTNSQGDRNYSFICRKCHLPLPPSNP